MDITTLGALVAAIFSIVSLVEAKGRN